MLKGCGRRQRTNLLPLEHTNPVSGGGADDQVPPGGGSQGRSISLIR